jgi:hypothetical protein
VSGARDLRKHATSLLLIAAALGIGSYVYFVDRGSISDNERKRRQNDVFPAYRREEVARVEVSRPGAQKLVLERAALADGGDPSWSLRSGPGGSVGTVADQAAVERLLSAFEFASIVRKVDPKDAVGLDAPRASGLLGMGRLVYRFALGAAAPVPEGSAYFRVDGQGTYVITHELASALVQDPDTYRERTIVPYLSLDLSGLVVRSKAGGTLALERLDGTSFRLSDVGLRASREKLDRVWSALGEMRAESFLDDGAADRATEDPLFSLVLTPTDKAKPVGEIVVGGPCPDHPEDVVVVRTKPTRVSACAPRGILEGLATTRDALEDRRLFAGHGDEIEELKVEGLGGDARRLELARKGNGWHERAPRDRELSGDEVDATNALAEALAHAEGTDVKRGDPAPIAGRSRVTVTRVDRGGDESVVLGPADGAFATVQRTADGALLRVSAEVARKLLPSEIAIRSRDLFDPALAKRSPARIASRCDRVTQELTHEGGLWTLRDPSSGASFPADVAGALDLASAVGRAKATQWVADADDGSFGLDPGACSLTVAFLDDTSPRDAASVTPARSAVALQFGRPREGEEGGYYARIDGDGPVFVAPRSLRALASRWLIDRAGFRVDPATIDAVTLVRGPKVVVLTRRGQSLSRADGGGGAGEEGEKVGEALAGLRAEGTVHIGPARADEGLAPPTLDVRVHRTGDAGASLHFVVGHGAVWEDQKVYFARLDGVDATFAIAEARLAPLLDAL